MFHVKKGQKKSRILHNNAGSFLSIQAKYAPNNWKSELGQILIAQLHWGQNLPISKNISFNYHIGMGYAPILIQN